MRGYAFANPAGLWALALLVPVVLMHLYRRRRRRVEVAFLPLLRETAGATTAQGAWKNVHETASLLLRCAALVAAALALAGPRPAYAGPPPRDLVLVIDADVTTCAIEERRHAGTRDACYVTRFTKQADLAEALVRSQAGARTAIVLAGETPEVLASFSDDAQKALRELRGAGCRARGDLAAALRVARTVPGAGAAARLLAITSRALPAGFEDVEALGAGTLSDDQGFVDQSVELSADGLSRSVRLVVRNFGVRTASRRVIARTFMPFFGRPQRSETVFDRTLALASREEAEVSFQVTPPREGAALRAELDADDFAFNDATGAWLAPVTRPSVLVVHGGAPRPFVTALLEAMGESIERATSGSVLARDLPSAKARDVTIVDGVAIPKGIPLSGGWIFLAPFSAGGGDLPFVAGKAVDRPLVWRANAGHPLLRGVDLATAYVARGTTIAAPGSESLAFAEGEPVVAEGSTGAGGRWIAFGLDPDGSDLPLRAALPVLMRNAVRRLGTAPAEMLKAFYRAGEVVRPRVDLPGLRHDEDPFGGPHSGTFPCGGGARDEPRDNRNEVTAAAGDLLVPAGGRGEVENYYVLPDRAWIHRTAFIDLSRETSVVPVRPAATPPPPAPPAPDRDAAAARLRAILIAAAAALLLADLLLLALRGAADRRGKVAAPPAKAYPSALP